MLLDCRRELETPPFFPADARNFRDEARIAEGGKIGEKRGTRLGRSPPRVEHDSNRVRCTPSEEL